MIIILSDETLLNSIKNNFSIFIKTSYENTESEIIHWCREKFGNEMFKPIADPIRYDSFECNEDATWDFCYFNADYDYPYGYTFAFKNNDDALLFKLAWL